MLLEACQRSNWSRWLDAMPTRLSTHRFTDSNSTQTHRRASENTLTSSHLSLAHVQRIQRVALSMSRIWSYCSWKMVQHTHTHTHVPFSSLSGSNWQSREHSRVECDGFDILRNSNSRCREPLEVLTKLEIRCKRSHMSRAVQHIQDLRLPAIVFSTRNRKTKTNRFSLKTFIAISLHRSQWNGDVEKNVLITLRYVASSIVPLFLRWALNIWSFCVFVLLRSSLNVEQTFYS